MIFNSHTSHAALRVISNYTEREEHCLEERIYELTQRGYPSFLTDCRTVDTGSDYELYIGEYAFPSLCVKYSKAWNHLEASLGTEKLVFM